MSEYCLEERYRNTNWTETILSLDLFALPAPSFNFEGRRKIGSALGLVASTFFMLSLGLFIWLKAGRFINGTNPLIAYAEEKDVYTSEDAIDLYEVQMLHAF